MPRGLYVHQPGQVTIRRFEPEPLKPHELRVRVEFAAIKHGTIFHHYSGESPFEHRYFDVDRRLFLPRDQPNPAGGFAERFIGDMIVGDVIEVGGDVRRFTPGDRVYSHGPLCDVVTLPEDRLHPLPEGMSPGDAVCMDPAFFAYGSVRDAQTVLAGADVAVFGLGAIGQFIVQLLRQSGVLNLIAFDPIARRRELASRHGADHMFDPAERDPGLVVRELLGPGKGADVVFEASGHYKALAGAMRAAGHCAKVVTSGYYKGKDTELELGADWFHNRLDMICSLPAWQNPMREHPVWTEDRMNDVLERMFVLGRLTSDGITDPIVGLDDAADAFKQIYDEPSHAIKLCVQF